MGKKKNKKEKTEKPQKKVEPAEQTPRQDVAQVWIRRGSFLLLVIVLSILSLFWIPGDVHYQITETYTFTATETDLLHLTLLLPTSGPYQEVFEPDVVCPGEFEIEKVGRLKLLRLEAEILSGQTIEAVITYDVHLFQGSARWTGMPSRSYDLAPEPDIQSDAPALMEEAELVSVLYEKRQTVRKIFGFTMRHLDWPRDSRINADLSALNAYRTGVGGSIEHANLMTALSRAAGIPAHPVSGLVMPVMLPLIPVSQTWDHPASAHAWVEFYLNGTWEMADPSWSGKFLKHDLLGWTDGRHLAYDETASEAAIYGQIVAEAEENGNWTVAMSAPLRFAAWSEVSIDSMVFIPVITLRKTWDARLVMLISLVVIVTVLYFLNREDRRQEKIQKISER
jgi:hypothetical protein